MSDSQAAIKALSSCVISSKMVWECLHKLNELGESNMVTLLWIPGHNGVEGNKIAKRGTEIPFWVPEPFYGISPNVILEEIGKAEKRSDHWKDLVGLIQ